MTTKRKPGAPKGNQNARKTKGRLGKPVAFRLPEQDREALEQAAERDGLTPNQWAARVVMEALR